MNENFSTTQATNIASLAGVIVLILGYFKIDIGAGEIQAIFGAALTLYGIGANWYHRYKKGDLTLGGFRKD